MQTHPRSPFSSMALLLFAAGSLALTGCSGSRAERGDSYSDAGADSAAPVTEVAGPSGRLHVDDGGAGGVPVVFVHAFAGNASHWNDALAHLRQTRRAVALDLRGHGLSEAPVSGSYDVDSLAADIAAVVDRLGLPRFVLVGHSMGAAAAIAYAGAHPDRVAGLVMVGGPGQTSPAQTSQVLASLEKDYDGTMAGYWKQLLEGAQPAVAARIDSESKALPKDASMHLVRALFEFDPVPPLEAYAGPKLIIDTAHGDDTPKSLHNLQPEVPRRVIAGTSHWPQLDRPDEFNAQLDEFLASNPS